MSPLAWGTWWEKLSVAVHPGSLTLGAELLCSIILMQMHAVATEVENLEVACSSTDRRHVLGGKSLCCASQ